MKDYFKKEFDPYTQMNTFICKLAKADVPFQVIGFPSSLEGFQGTLQVLIPSTKAPLADFVCHAGSYGHDYGLMEIMVHDDEVLDELYLEFAGDAVIGHLDADNAFRLTKEILSTKAELELLHAPRYVNNTGVGPT